MYLRFRINSFNLIDCHIACLCNTRPRAALISQHVERVTSTHRHDEIVSRRPLLRSFKSQNVGLDGIPYLKWSSEVISCDLDGSTDLSLQHLCQVVSSTCLAQCTSR